MQEHGVLPEIEVFDLSHIHGARRLADLGVINERPHVQFVMGVKNAHAGATAHILDFSARSFRACCRRRRGPPPASAVTRPK